MEGKGKILLAFEGLATEFSIVIPYLDIFLRDHWEEVTKVPWWAVLDDDIEANLKVASDLLEKLKIDWIPTGLCRPKQWRETHQVKVRDNRVSIVNTETGSENEIQKPPLGGHQVLVKEAKVKTVEDIERFVKVIPSKQLVDEGRLDLAKAVVSEFSDRFFVYASIGAPLWSTYSYFGFYEMMTNLVERQDLVEPLIEAITRANLEILKAYASVGIDGVWIEDSYTSADLISLEHFRQFNLPYLKRYIDAIRQFGMKSIYYICGDVSDRLEDIVALQPDALALEESKKGFVIDIDEIDRHVGGRVCLLGNIDAIGILQNGDKQTMEKEIQRQIEVGRRTNKFIISLGSPVTPLTPVSKVCEFVQLARELARKIH